MATRCTLTPSGQSSRRRPNRVMWTSPSSATGMSHHRAAETKLKGDRVLSTANHAVSAVLDGAPPNRYSPSTGVRSRRPHRNQLSTVAAGIPQRANWRRVMNAAWRCVMSVQFTRQA